MSGRRPVVGVTDRKQAPGSLVNPFDLVGLLLGRDELVAAQQKARQEQDRFDRRVSEQAAKRWRREKNRMRRRQYAKEIKALRAKAKKCPACRGRTAQGGWWCCRPLIARAERLERFVKEELR